MINPFYQIIIVSSIFSSGVDGLIDSILCLYINSTSQIQIARITNIPNYYWERVIFPGQKLIFTAVMSANLEINTSEHATTIGGSESIPCHNLYIDESETSIRPRSLTLSSWLNHLQINGASSQ